MSTHAERANAHDILTMRPSEVVSKINVWLNFTLAVAAMCGTIYGVSYQIAKTNEEIRELKTAITQLTAEVRRIETKAKRR